MAAPQTSSSGQRSPRALMRAGLVLLILAVAGGVLLYFNVTSLTRTAIERLASDTLGVDVTIDSLDVDAQTMRITLKGLTVGNPKPYGSPYAIKVGSVDIEAARLSKDIVEFGAIRALDTKINLEVRKDQTNLTTLRAQVNAGEADGTSDVRAEQPVKILIHDLQINGAKLYPVKTLSGGGQAPAVLPDIKISAGEKSGGVTSSEAIANIVGILVRVSIYKAGQEGYLQGMSDDAMGELSGDIYLGNDAMSRVKTGLSAGVQKVGRDLKNFSRGVKELLSGEEKKAAPGNGTAQP